MVVVAVLAVSMQELRCAVYVCRIVQLYRCRLCVCACCVYGVSDLVRLVVWCVTASDQGLIAVPFIFPVHTMSRFVKTTTGTQHDQKYPISVFLCVCRYTDNIAEIPLEYKCTSCHLLHWRKKESTQFRYSTQKTPTT